MRDDAEILRRMIPLTGDLTKPGREADRVAVETANSRITNVMHLGSATGSEFEHGVREKYPNMYIYGSINQCINKPTLTPRTLGFPSGKRSGPCWEAFAVKAVTILPFSQVRPYW